MKKEKEEIIVPSCNNCNNSNVFFCSLSCEEMDMISTTKRENFFKKDTAIFTEGHYAKELFCLFSGKVKLSKIGKDGKEQIIRFYKNGNILGYRSLLSNEPYHATAIAMEDSYVCMIKKERFFQIIKENPKFSLNVIQLLSKELKDAEQHLIDVSQKTVKGRISEALLLLMNTFGYLPDEETLDIKMTRSEIADIAGTTTESTIRALAQLKDERLIRLDGKSIAICDLKGLIRSANAFD